MQRLGPDHFTQMITLPAPAFEGFVRVRVEGSTPVREAVSEFFLSAGWGPNNRISNSANSHVWGPNNRISNSANSRAWGANNRSLEAPVAAGDGRVTIFNLSDLLGEPTPPRCRRCTMHPTCRPG
jgi:hypothetical protein